MLGTKDTAGMLGVSTATVSLVLNNKSGVGEERRQGIIQKVEGMDCGYMLEEQRISNGSIGFVVYKCEGSIMDESPPFTYILEGINNRINHYGYTLNFLYINKTMPRTEQGYQIKSGGYKGFIIFAVEIYYDDLQLFKKSQIPLVILNNSSQEDDVDAVSINNIQDTSKAISYLYGMGHRGIGYTRNKIGINSLDERYNAFKYKLRSLGDIFNKKYMIDVGHSEKDVKQDMKKYLEGRRHPPTAFFAENDLIGYNAVRVMQECGYRIPEDISVVGFDSRSISILVESQLATINVPRGIFGPAAVDLLISRLDQGREQSLKVEIGTSLVKRGSVRRITN